MSLQGSVCSCPASLPECTACHSCNSCLSIHPLLSRTSCFAATPHSSSSAVSCMADVTDWFICAHGNVFWVKNSQLKNQCFMGLWSMFLLGFNSNSFIFYSLRQHLAQQTTNRLSSWKFSKFASLFFPLCVKLALCASHRPLFNLFPVESSVQERIWDEFS